MAIEIVDFPIKNGGSFHSYVKLPEGNHTIPWWLSITKRVPFYQDHHGARAVSWESWVQQAAKSTWSSFTVAESVIAFSLTMATTCFARPPWVMNASGAGGYNSYYISPYIYIYYLIKYCMLSNMCKIEKQQKQFSKQIQQSGRVASCHQVNLMHHWPQALSSIHPAADSFPGVGFSRKASPTKKLFSNSSERILANISDKVPAALSSAATRSTELARHSAKIVDFISLLKQL